MIRRWWSRRQARRHCPHSRLEGIYGDAINHTPGGRRLWCRGCRRPIDGPASLAVARRPEWEREAA